MARLMREDNLLCRVKPLFRPPTTDARHGWRVWPTLARHRQPMATSQLWVADITHVRLAESSMKTLKHEEVDASADRDLAHAGMAIGAFIETAYNRQRLPLALA